MRDLAGRRIPKSVPALYSTLVTILVVVAGAFICGVIGENWTMPNALGFGLTFAAGLFMMFGHLFTLLAYKNASAQAVAPFYYSFMIFAVAMGYFIFGDVPNALALVGMAVIMGSGLALVGLERKASGTAD